MENNLMTEREKLAYKNYLNKFDIEYNQAKIEWNNFFMAVYAENRMPLPENFQEIVSVCATSTAKQRLLTMNNAKDTEEKTSQK